MARVYLDTEGNEHRVEENVIRDLRVNVRDGAKALDDVLPGWEKAINKRRLSLATPSPGNTQSWMSRAKEGFGCVLCQLDAYIDTDERLPRMPIPVEDFGEFIYGSQKLAAALEEHPEYHVDESSFDPAEFGFDCGGTVHYIDGDVEFAILDELWTEEINNRLEKGDA